MMSLSYFFLYLFFFFFSSRRRHTRLTCDWSSDVCSSDLWDNNRLLHQLRTQIALGAALRKGQRLESENLTLRRDGAPELIASSPAMQRSEERRVGKECRSRWAPDHQKKNNEKEEIRATRG